MGSRLRGQMAELELGAQAIGVVGDQHALLGFQVALEPRAPEPVLQTGIGKRRADERQQILDGLRQVGVLTVGALAGAIEGPAQEADAAPLPGIVDRQAIVRKVPGVAGP